MALVRREERAADGKDNSIAVDDIEDYILRIERGSQYGKGCAMIQFPRFTQYYIVSTIFPGIFNALAIAYAMNSTFYPIRMYRLESYEWLFMLFSAIILTLTVGMLFERSVFWMVTRGWSVKEKDVSRDHLKNWRMELIDIFGSGNYQKCDYVVKNTEKLMSEYYCLNNIIPGILIIAAVCVAYLLLYLCGDYTYPILLVIAWISGKVLILGPMSAGITYCAFVVMGCCLTMWLLGWVMRTWLCELRKLL